MLDLRGHIAPLITPFTDDGSGISEIRLARLVRRLVAHGVNGFVVCTDTGEFMCLSFSERKQVLEIVVRECQGALPVLTNVSTLSTSSSLDLAQHAHRHGARALVMMPPYYGTYSDLEIEWHYRTVAQYSDAHIAIVDPMGRVTPELRAKLETIDRVAVTEPPSGTDSFLIGTADVSPIWNLPCTLPAENARSLFDLARAFGGAKVIKSALYEFDLEMGTPRKPLQALDRQVQLAVATLVQPFL